MDRPYNRLYALFFISVLFFYIPNVYAQETQSMGIKGGFTLTTLTNQDPKNIKPGLQIGGFAKFGGGESLFFKAELLATQSGTWNWDRNQPNNISLYYLDLPLMFGIETFRGLSLNLGIQPSILIAGTYRSSIDGNTNTRSIGDNLSRFDYSYLIGAEYLSHNNWLIGLRYNFGFIPIQDHRGELTIQNEGELLSNRILQIYFGYVLR